jgi:ribosomal protein L13E
MITTQAQVRATVAQAVKDGHTHENAVAYAAALFDVPAESVREVLSAQQDDARSEVLS